MRKLHCLAACIMLMVVGGPLWAIGLTGQDNIALVFGMLMLLAGSWWAIAVLAEWDRQHPGAK